MSSSLGIVSINQKWTRGLDYKIQTARIDCFIFFYLCLMGWGPTKVVVNEQTGAKNVYCTDPPLSKIEVLGYPNRRRMVKALERMKPVCHAEMQQYRKLILAYKEVRRRWLATTNDQTWDAYIHGTKSWNSLAYQSKVLKHRKVKGNIFNCGYFKYSLFELLPRGKEKKRAWNEIRDIQKKLSNVRNAIFDKMEVPNQFRRLAG